MLKDKLDISTKGKDNIGYDVDLNIIENGRNETKIRQRKIVEYFNSLTKHINFEDKKVIVNGILIDLSIKAIIDFDDLNGNLIKPLHGMRKSEYDLVLKRSSLMMLLHSDVNSLNINMLSKLIDASRKSMYNIMNHLTSGGEGSTLLKLTTRCTPMTPITSEIKNIIRSIFWTNKSRVSPNKKDLHMKRFEGVNMRSIPYTFLMYLRYLHLSKSCINDNKLRALSINSSSY